MIRSYALLLAELAALFFGVAVLVQLTQRRLGADRLRRWMGGSPFTSALKGIAVGFITPFCTYSAIPLLVGLRQAGVSTAGYVAFIVAAPVLDPVLFGALVLIVGAKAALTYVAVAFSAAMTLALVADRVDISRHLKPLPASMLVTVAAPPGATGVGPQEQACDTQSPQPAWQGLARELPIAITAARGLLRSMGPLLLLGVTIGLGIEALVSPEFAARIAGEGNAFAIPVAAALGTPLYFNTELFVPIAHGLSTAGVGLGAIVALTIAGAGANLPEFVILSRLASRRVIGVFFGYVFGVAMLGGVLAQMIAS